MQQVLGRSVSIIGDGRLQRLDQDPPVADVEELRKVRRKACSELRLGDRIHFGAVVERAYRAGELVVADVDVVLIEAEQRLVAEAGATSATGIGCVEVIVEDAIIGRTTVTLRCGCRLSGSMPRMVKKKSHSGVKCLYRLLHVIDMASRAGDCTVRVFTCNHDFCDTCVVIRKNLTIL